MIKRCPTPPSIQMAKAGTYYFDGNNKLIGREMKESEIKKLSREQLLELVIGKWEANTGIYQGPIALECPDGSLLTYINVDVCNHDVEPYQSQSVNVKKGGNPKIVFKRMYED
jgi:hypothetical protein